MTAGKAHRALRIAAALGAAAFAVEAGASSDPCRPPRLETAAQAAANERLELLLADGRLIRLAGVESPSARGAEPRFMESASEDFALWTSSPIAIFTLKAQPDRWGRQEARAFIAEKGFAPDLLPSLSEAVIDAGFARVDPSSETRPCLDRLYAAEARARAARRGLWADPAFAVLDAGKPLDSQAQAGKIAIVEGRVASVRAGRGVTFVNLGDGSPRSPSLTLGREALRAMQREGVEPEALAGRKIRARGVLDLRAGPRIEVAGPNAIEMLEDARSAGR
ncbi:MAG: thermonuclease family protein [Beijerinckiaceae bacterium]